MIQKLYITAFILLLTNYPSLCQPTNLLRQKIQAITATKKAKVGVAITSYAPNDTLAMFGDDHFPMQSVFKLHIALAVLSGVDNGKFRLDQKINIELKDLLPTLYSPIREKYPQGATLTLGEIITYTVSESDNVGCELLLKLIGGPSAVEQYFTAHAFKNISIKINEETMQANWDLQYQNWTTPKAANDVLSSFYTNQNKLLSPKSHAFIWAVMKETQTGQHRLKGQLPAGTSIAHKTGSSGTNKAGLTAAVNDIGVILLPNGKPVFISVFVSDSRENAETNEKIISDIGKATWDYFVSKGK